MQNTANLFGGDRKPFGDTGDLAVLALPDFGDHDFCEFLANLLKSLVAHHALRPVAQRIADAGNLKDLRLESSEIFGEVVILVRGHQAGSLTGTTAGHLPVLKEVVGGADTTRNPGPGGQAPILRALREGQSFVTLFPGAAGVNRDVDILAQLFFHTSIFGRRLQDASARHENMVVLLKAEAVCLFCLVRGVVDVAAVEVEIAEVQEHVANTAGVGVHCIDLPRPFQVLDGRLRKVLIASPQAGAPGRRSLGALVRPTVDLPSQLQSEQAANVGGVHQYARHVDVVRVTSGVKRVGPLKVLESSCIFP